MRVLRVGLLLGTEVGFPEALEHLLEACAPDLARRDPPVRLEVERVRLGPFRAGDPVPYDLVLDRVSHWHPFAREWLKTAALDGCYVVSHPFHFQCMEKQVGAAALARLGLDVPPTWALPPKDQEGLLPGAAERLHELFSLGEVGEDLGYPLFLKPHDGGGWVGVSRCADAPELQAAYDGSGSRVMLAQADVSSARFARCLVAGPAVGVLAYDPGAPLHARYRVEAPDLADPLGARLARLARWVAALFGFEVTSVEVLVRGERLHPIDYFNAVPDLAPTSLHAHFVPAVTAIAEWLLFCLLSGRRPRLSTRLARWMELGKLPGPQAAREQAYDQLAGEYFRPQAFDDFRRRELAFLPGHAEAYRASPALEAHVGAAVAAVFPAHEHEAFTGWFLERMRPGSPGPAPWYGSRPSAPA